MPANIAFIAASRAAGLVLGHSTESSSPKEFRGPKDAGGLENTVLSVGKRPSSRADVSYEPTVCTLPVRHSGESRNPGFRSTNWIPAYAGMTEHSRCVHTEGYEQGLTTASTLVAINYLLTRSLSIRVQAGLSPAVDLFLHVQFRFRAIYAARPDRLHTPDPQTRKRVRETKSAFKRVRKLVVC